MQFINKQDDFATGLLHFLQNGFQALFKLPAELGSGNQRPHIQRHHAPILEVLGHVAMDNPLGKTLNDGSFSDARLPDKDRVVLGAA